MAQRPQTNDTMKKEIWDHFKPEELEVFGAYCYGFDGLLPHLAVVQEKDKDTGKVSVRHEEQKVTRFFQDNFHEARPWSIYERFRRAYIILDRKMKANPHQKRFFAIADIQEDGSIQSGNSWLEPAIRAKSKQVYDNIFGKGGSSWGNEEALQEYVDGHGGEVCKSYGFKPCEAPPLEVVYTGLDGMDLETSNSKPERNSFADPIIGEEKKQRGRPRKVVEE